MELDLTLLPSLDNVALRLPDGEAIQDLIDAEDLVPLFR
jgi:hypothetical protein